MKKIIAIALLTASTAAQAYSEYEFCNEYAGLLKFVVEQKNKGYEAKTMLDTANESMKDAPTLRKSFMADIARIYTVDGYLAPDKVEQRALLNCLKGD